MTTQNTLRLIHDRLFAADYAAARSRIAADREEVEQLIASDSSAPIYGFTTLLGHLDHVRGDDASQEGLLAAHLVGPARAFPGTWAELLARVKLANVLAGGSGMHPESYDLLADLAQRLAANPDHFGAWEGNWTASYGSGDVVPAAWFANGLVEKAGLKLDHAGDLIVLINGHFVSTTAALFAAARFLDLTAEARRIVEHASARPAGPAQPPVTLRDPSPLFASLTEASDRLLEAILRRLTGPSANPRFALRDGGLAAVSQSSFLDFTLTAALTGCIHAVAQAGVYVKAAILDTSRHAPEDSSTSVQHAKIAESYLREMSGLAPLPHFSLLESHGVEDVCDQSLLTARLLSGALHALERVLTAHSEAARQPRTAQPPAGPLSVIRSAAPEVTNLLRQ